MSLYRRYRPQDFSGLLGQSHVVDVLQGALKSDRISHAYLFTGPRGTGKTSTARILSRALNCLKKTPQGPCNECEICKAALEERLTDLVEIDAASHGLVDDARALVEQAKFLPTQAEKKVYIIDEVHMLSKSAFNALLKIIEEPPNHVHFILATTEAHKVLETITSRCQRFDFHLADRELIATRLAEVCDLEKAAFDQEALNVLADHAKGSFRDALSLLDQLIGEEKITVERVREVLGLADDSALEMFLESLLKGHKDQALQVLSEVYESGFNLSEFCHSVLAGLRSQLLKGAADAQALEIADVLMKALVQLKDPVHPTLPLELAVVRLCQTPQSVSQQVASVVPAASAPAPESESKTAVQESPVKAVPVASAGFDSSSFLDAVSNASLKNLLKFSQLKYDQNRLHIGLRSSFEHGKLTDAALYSLLQKHCESFFSDKPEIVVEVLDNPAPPPAAGIQSEDLESIF